MSTGTAIVKSVLSGDTLVLKHPSQKIEKLLTLTHLQAPRFGSRGGPASSEVGMAGKTDEAFAWESREFLRKLVVGKQVKFTVLYQNPNAKRDYGTVQLLGATASEAGSGPGDEGGDDVSVRLVQSGWVRVKKPTREDANVDEYQAMLIALEEKAMNGKVGMFSSTTRPAQVAPWGTYDGSALLSAVKGTKQTCVVEQVIDGAFVRLLMMPSYQMILVRQTGISCPSIKDENPEEAALGERAKEFTESRLLQRSVSVEFEGMDKNGTCLFASIVSPSGKPFSEALLADGLARIQEWNMALTKFAAQLRKAERVAKERCLGVWKDYVAPEGISSITIPSAASAVGSASSASASSGGAAAAATTLGREFSAHVIEVVSGDTIVVLPNGHSMDAQLSVSLASIRAPRLAPKRPGLDTGSEDEPYAFEAKEMLRKALVGKAVRVRVDYKRKSPDNQRERLMATVIQGKINAAVALVEAGLALVLKHKAGDDERARDYDQLSAAEIRAKEGKVGIHSTGQAPKQHINEVNNAQKARQFLPFLQRAKRQPAIVVYVSTGSRVRLYLPKESCVVAFAIEGIRSPQPPANREGGPKGEVFGLEALWFAREHILQREVEVEVTGVDPKGTFLGALFVPGTSTLAKHAGKVNFAEWIVEEGLSRLHRQSLDRSPYAEDLKKAAERGRAAAKGLFTLGQSEQDAFDTAEDGDDAFGGDESSAAGRSGEYRDPTIVIPLKPESVRLLMTDIVDGTTFYAVPESNALSAIAAGLESLGLDEIAPEKGAFAIEEALKKNKKSVSNMPLLAKFSADGKWYRARVVQVFESEKIAEVLYVDFGNVERVAFRDTRPMTSAYSDVSLERVPAQAMLCHLAFVRAPSDENGDDCAFELGRLAQDFDAKTGQNTRVLTAQVQYRSVNGRESWVVLLDYTRNVNINATLIHGGFARVQSRREAVFQAIVSQFTQEQEFARTNRRGIWRYGDYESDEENM
eukprot:ANDGO_04131.mRNA.1 Staphylococcal nuclease domain-containing protein 1